MATTSERKAVKRRQNSAGARAARVSVEYFAAIEARNKAMRRFGNLIAGARRDALSIIKDDRPDRFVRLGFVGERLMLEFSEIDACTTVEQRLELIGANRADYVEANGSSMMHLVLAQSLEWSAMRRNDDFNHMHRTPLYWAIGTAMIDFMCSKSPDGSEPSHPSLH